MVTSVGEIVAGGINVERHEDRDQQRNDGPELPTFFTFPSCLTAGSSTLNGKGSISHHSDNRGRSPESHERPAR